MNQTTLDIRAGRAGDVVVIAGHRLGERERKGEVLEVLGEEDRVHYRVRWEDGNESVFYPGSDASIRRSSHTDAQGPAHPTRRHAPRHEPNSVPEAFS
jgi:hypothetical protein